MNDEQSPPGDPDPQRRCLPTNLEKLKYALEHLREWLQWLESYTENLRSQFAKTLNERMQLKPIRSLPPNVHDSQFHDRAFSAYETNAEKEQWNHCKSALVAYEESFAYAERVIQDATLIEQALVLDLPGMDVPDVPEELRRYFAWRAVTTAASGKVLMAMYPYLESMQGLEQEMLDALAKGAERYTRPMTITELLPYLPYGRNAMPGILEQIGAEKIGSKWRVPLSKMPPEYLMKLERTAAMLAEKDAD